MVFELEKKEKTPGEFIDSMVKLNPEVTGLSDKEPEELKMRLEILLFSVEAECNRRGI